MKVKFTCTIYMHKSIKVNIHLSWWFVQVVFLLNMSLVIHTLYSQPCYYNECSGTNLLKDTLNKGHLSIKDKFCMWSLQDHGNTILSLNEDHLSITVKSNACNGLGHKVILTEMLWEHHCHINKDCIL